MEKTTARSRHYAMPLQLYSSASRRSAVERTNYMGLFIGRMIESDRAGVMIESDRAGVPQLPDRHI